VIGDQPSGEAFELFGHVAPEVTSIQINTSHHGDPVQVARDVHAHFPALQRVMLHTQARSLTASEIARLRALPYVALPEQVPLAE
jgi:hypothetical protein